MILEIMRKVGLLGAYLSEGQLTTDRRMAIWEAIENKLGTLTENDSDLSLLFSLSMEQLTENQRVKIIAAYLIRRYDNNDANDKRMVEALKNYSSNPDALRQLRVKPSIKMKKLLDEISTCLPSYLLINEQGYLNTAVLNNVSYMPLLLSSENPQSMFGRSAHDEVNFTACGLRQSKDDTISHFDSEEKIFYLVETKNNRNSTVSLARIYEDGSVRAHNVDGAPQEAVNAIKKKLVEICGHFDIHPEPSCELAKIISDSSAHKSQPH